MLPFWGPDGVSVGAPLLAARNHVLTPCGGLLGVRLGIAVLGRPWNPSQQGTSSAP